MADLEPAQIDFGPNIWLVDEVYRQYLEDPESVSEAWQEFFEDYRPQSPVLNAVPVPAAQPVVEPLAPTTTAPTSVVDVPSPDGAAATPAGADGAEPEPLR
ncbi:MAG TPA: hypothetical protein VID03_01040, partial [Acidimicrobiia bacterium]